MATYAVLDENNIVVNVIKGADEGTDGKDWEEFYTDFMGMTCKRTSINTNHNQHLDGGTPFRGNYAVIGGTYDETNDIFMRPKPFESWTLDLENAQWQPPVAFPDDGNRYDWNEETQSWDLVE